MIELSLVLGLAAGAGLLAVLLARWVLSQGEGEASAQRLLHAAQRAAAEFSWRQARRATGLGGAVWLLLTIAGPALGFRPGDGVLAITTGMVVGIGLSVGLGRLGVHLAIRGAAGTATSLPGPVGYVVDHGLRSSAASSLLAECASLLVAVGSLVPLALDAGPESLRGIRLFATSVTMGAVAPALLYAVSGGAMQLAGQTGRWEPLLHAARHSYQLDARNPTLVLDVVGGHVARTAARVQNAFSVSLFAHGTSVAAILLLLRDSPELGPALPLLALPLVVRACSLVATGFALLLTRSEESDNVSSALLRGPLASVVFSVAALLGATLWLLGKDRYMPFFLSGTVGAIGSLLVGLSGHLRPRRGNAAPRELEETARLSSALALAASQATAFLRAAWTSAPLLVCVGIGWSLLPLLGVDGWPLSLAMVVTGYFATHSHTAALYGFDSVMDSASGLGSLTDAHAHPEVQNRLSSLVGAATHVGAIARDALGTGTALLSLTATALCYLVLSESGAPGPSSAATSGAVPSLVWIAVGAISGLITILLFCGSVIRHLVGAATKLKQELERQLRGFARGVSGLVELPSDFKPRYRDHLESASREALSRVEFPCALGLLLPLTLFLTIASLEPRTEGPTLALTLVSFVGAVSLGGLVIAKLSDSTHASWTAAYRTARPPQPETAGTRSPIDHGISATTSALATTELFVVAAACAGLLVAALLF